MAEFTPIMSQEQFDAAIGDRLKRERETMSKKYGDYDALKGKVAEYEQQIGTMTKTMEENAKKYAGYDQSLAELQAQVKGYETSSVKMRIAHEVGIPYEMAARLSGETEDDIRKDAQTMAQYVKGSSSRPAPLKSTEPAGEGRKAVLRSMLRDLKGE